MFGFMGRVNQSPLTKPLVSHVDSISPIELWYSRGTRKSIHSKDTPSRKSGAYNSTTVDKDTPHFNTPLAPYGDYNQHAPIRWASSEYTIVHDIMADLNINPNLLQIPINTLSSRINTMQSAQATPTLGKLIDKAFTTRGQNLKPKPHSLGGQAAPIRSISPFDHQGSAIESSYNDPNQSKHNSNNQTQHPPSTLELKKLKAELEERHRINTECIKQILNMQHHRHLQTVRDESQRRLDDALTQVRSSEKSHSSM